MVVVVGMMVLMLPSWRWRLEERCSRCNQKPFYTLVPLHLTFKLVPAFGTRVYCTPAFLPRQFGVYLPKRQALGISRLQSERCSFSAE